MARSVDLFAQAEQDDHSTTSEVVVGRVVTTFFAGKDSFYKVLLVKVEEHSFAWDEAEIVVTGDFAEIGDDISYRFVGKLVDHPKYGKQFQAVNYQRNQQTSVSGLIKYLAGSDFPGVGPKSATKIVQTLGLNLIEQVLKNPAILDRVPLTAQQKKTVLTTLQQNNGTEQVIVGLNSFGFGSKLATAIFKKYHEEALTVIQEDPYRLVGDIPNISFKRADQLAQQLGISYNDPTRLQAGLITTLEELANTSGSTYANREEVVRASFSVLNTDPNQTIDEQQLGQALQQLVTTQQIMVVDEEKFYLKRFYDAERQIANQLQRIAKAPTATKTIDYETALATCANQLKINYDQSQHQAILAALNQQLFILTGGPGTGKTTIIKGIVQTFAVAQELSLELSDYHDQPFPVLLAAPTGRAAKKMSEATGIPASTIHRLLGLNGNEEPGTSEIDGQLLIIDEMSMVDTELFAKLVQAIPTGMKLILVGDQDQLPSVGPGQVFYDLIHSQTIATQELTQIHRQSSDSTIVDLAHEIRMGMLPPDLLKKAADRSFIPCGSQQVVQVIEQVVKKAHQHEFATAEIQVLAPMYRGVAGIDHLNTALQPVLNPPAGQAAKEVNYRDTTYRIGDKVLQLTNDADQNVFNGDIGKIVGIDVNNQKKPYLDKLIIDFDDSEVTYSRNDWNQITLAYCTSIHKAQGSEFQLVVLPLVPQYGRMLQRNLLYTAVTRAAEKLIMVGDPQAFQTCLEHESSNRKTFLEHWLHQVFTSEGDSTVPARELQSEPQDKLLTLSAIQNNEIDPMIGMDGIVPTDFLRTKSTKTTI
ncbi:RecD-like DNA helicase YrrC [Fructilactobacillus florum 8D]|uniref:ATP-dependent RecD2 DNA helicase n=1 Tax=Fructilactobacillus florum 8D TaxID=1221538 RepID=W9EFG1_9LACO|nr:ATP-dependent RecD-like DNA helicase [Fructilactobacillus florum]ETO39986.1 RecD-like DNA helicase YrrC [Fructilactobacillus florum 8D]